MARLSAQQRISLTIFVAALGYFVDVFDLQLFGLLRVDSLKSLGLAPAEITSTGAALLNWQMAGMLVGGILWGIMGDRKGRVPVLFGTILLYSVANLANGFVTSIPEYAAARFFAGFGLAGEVGAGITLASELLPAATRGYATTLVVACGLMGPVTANFIIGVVDWHTAYIIGGVFGFVLLFLRISVNESGLFDALKKNSHVARGRFRMLFSKRDRFFRYARCVTLGLPVWFNLGIMLIFAPEIATALGIDEPVKASTAVLANFVGATLGSLFSGLLSQFIKSRKKTYALSFAGTAACSVGIFFVHSAAAFYIVAMLFGIFSLWNMFMTITAEEFGTNLRATAATTAPNFARASVIVYTLTIGALKPQFGYLTAVQIVGVITFALTALSLWKLPETFGKDLEFNER